jgi:hypothetical protein
MKCTFDELISRMVDIPAHLRTRIICMLAWNLFGEGGDGETLTIDTDSKPGTARVRDALAYLRTELTKERPEVTIKEVLHPGAMELAPGQTLAAIMEQADARLAEANSVAICGDEIVFLGSDDHYYIGATEFVIAPNNRDRAAQALGVSPGSLKQGGDGATDD